MRNQRRRARRAAADHGRRRQRALRPVRCNRRLLIGRRHAIGISGRHEADDPPVAGIDHEPAVVAATVDHRDGVDGAAQARNAERREAVFTQHRVDLGGRQQHRRRAAFLIAVAVTWRRWRHGVRRPVGSVEIRHGDHGPAGHTARRNLSLSSGCRQRQRGRGHTSCEKLHGRHAPVRPPDGRALSLLAAWRTFRRADPKLHWGFRRRLGRIAACLLQNRGRATFGKRLIDISGIGTFARLCDRQKFGKVMVRTGRLSQFCSRFRHRDCSESRCLRAPGDNRQSRSRGRRTPWSEFLA